MSCRVPFVLALIAFARLAWGDAVISEFVASNQNGITDEDGDHTDWIEIRNADSIPVDLAGWRLTDLATNPAKWVFPNVQIPAKGLLVVFASGKDRRIAGQNLHTNFSLDANGEYLALIKPDGVTRTTEFSPKYPAQFPDVSYGAASPTQSLTLVQPTGSVRVIVPTDASLGTTWTARTFNDSSWTAGPMAVGYFNFNGGSSPDLSTQVGLNVSAQMGGQARSTYIRIPFDIPAGATVLQLSLEVNYDDGFAAYVNGQPSVSGNVTNFASLAYNSTANGSHGPTGYETFDLNGYIANLVPGTNILAIHGLNRSADSSDHFVQARLTAQIEAGAAGQIGYFATATPGVANGGNDTLRLPQQLTPSRPPGTFKTAFDLTLSGALAGQEIRYFITDPSGAGATITEPNSSSPLYTGPITISTSKLIRAAIFDPATGQRTETSTLQYLWLETGGTNNTSNFTSNLPIIVADDHGDGQPVDSGSNTYTPTILHVFEPVNGVAALDRVPDLVTRAGTRVRGSSSAGFPKKSFGMETWDEANEDLDRGLLGLEPDSDWVLNGPYQYDNTFIHNAYIFELSRQCGSWASRTRFCELFFNQNGGKLDYSDYSGVYVLTEKIKSRSHRVPIKNLQPSDNTGEAVTGGYIFKIDRADSGEYSWRVNGGSLPQDDPLVLVEPDPNYDTPAQQSYITNYTQAFSTVLLNERNAGFATRNYRDYIDTLQWVDHHILNSIAYNVDALRLSAFFYKDRNGKIAAGPIWDFDRALGSDDGRDSNPQSWNNIEYFFTRDWWGMLFQDPDFAQAWVDRWWEFRGGPLATPNLLAVADSMGAEIGNAAGARDAAIWSANAASGGVYLNEITRMKTWLNLRATWIDSRLPRAVTTSIDSGVVPSGTNVTVSGAGQFYYTLDGTDPRGAGGAIAPSAVLYAGGIPIAQTKTVNIRAKVTPTFPFPGGASVQWGPPVKRVYLVNEDFAVAGKIAISEINYHPLGPTPDESAAIPGVEASDFEFIELTNVGTSAINTFEMKFANGKPFAELRLEPATLAPAARVLVVKNRAAFALRYGSSLASAIVGEWKDGSLDDGGEEIQILARDGSSIQDFSYDDDGAWPGRSDGKGSALEYAGSSFSNAAYGDPANWRSSSEISGSPGVAGLGPDNRIVINEVLSQSQLPFVDAVELRNTAGTTLDVSKWYLSNASDPTTVDSFAQFQIPAGTQVPAGGYLVFDETDFNPNGPWNPNGGTPGPGEFAFAGSRDNDAWLIASDASGRPVRFVDHVQFGPSRVGESWGRWPDESGSLHPLQSQTLVDAASSDIPRAKQGRANSDPRVGPITIHEIHHSPPGSDPELKFIEIRNPTSAAIMLDGWRLRGDADFDFPIATQLAAGGVLVVVPFPPADASKATAFRTAYHVTNPITIMGPWSDTSNLASAGHSILYRLSAPTAEDPYVYPLTVEDDVNYRNDVAWPDSTHGFSLNRRGTSAVGDLADSWKGDAPSPGELNVTYPAWKAFYYPLGGSDSADLDGDGASTLDEYFRGTNPTTWENGIQFAPTLNLQMSGPQTNLVFQFQVPLDRNATYSAEMTEDFDVWTPVNSTVVGTTLDMEARQVLLPLDPMDASKAFLRVRMQLY